MTRRTPSADRRGRDFRPDVEGLRAIAVLAVLVYHLAPGLVPAGFIGVDIFFVISGFLITSHLAREHLQTGTISLSNFYARRALRLIPAATATLVGTAVAVALVVPRAYWSQFGGDLIAAGFYVVNWTLAEQSVNYLAEDNVLSPAQHFWSLAVEEQYYLLWPVLMIGVGLLAGLVRLPRRWAFALMGLVVAAASAGWAMHQVSQQNASAYFVTTSRLWELAAGSVVAIAYPAVQRVVIGRQAVAGVALVTVVASLWLISDPELWPNPAAFAPVLATAVALGVGGGASPTLVERVLGVAPLVWIGGLSYALYLWHWPLLIVSEYAFGEPGVLQGIAILVATFVLSWLTRITLEDPIRFHPRLRSRARAGLLVGLIGALLSAAAGAALVVVGSSSTVQRAVHAPGSSVLQDPISATPRDALSWSGKAVTPVPTEAQDVVPVLYEDDCHEPKESADVTVCTYGDRRAERTIAMIGDSKIMQWQSAIDRIARERHYKLVLLTKNACAFADAPAMHSHQAYPVCDAWRGPAFAELERLRPEVVFTGQGAYYAWPRNVTGQARLAAGLERMYARMREAGFTTVVVADNPHPREPVPACLQIHAEDPEVCAFRKKMQFSGEPSQRAAVAKLRGTQVDADAQVTRGRDRDLVLVDLNDAICPPQLKACPPVIGDMLIYRQGSHLSVAYVDSLTERLSAALDAAKVFER